MEYIDFCKVFCIVPMPDVQNAIQMNSIELKYEFILNAYEIVGAFSNVHNNIMAVYCSFDF